MSKIEETKKETLILSDLQILAEQHIDAMDRELQAAENLATQESEFEQIKTSLTASGFENGTIDGKNAEIRNAQTAAFLSSFKAYNDSKKAVKLARNILAAATNERKATETKISLVKAWLYAQSGLGKL